LSGWTVRNRQTGQTLPIKAIPDGLLSIVDGGGVYPLLERKGFISADTLGSRRARAIVP
jgi:hypothetical protein